MSCMIHELFLVYQFFIRQYFGYQNGMNALGDERTTPTG